MFYKIVNRKSKFENRKILRPKILLNNSTYQTPFTNSKIVVGRRFKDAEATSNGMLYKHLYVNKINLKEYYKA